jgi:hypothetical protein
MESLSLEAVPTKAAAQAKIRRILTNVHIFSVAIWHED